MPLPQQILRGSTEWLALNGPSELERLFQAVCVPPSVPILLTDDDRVSRAASMGVSKLFCRPRKEILGRCLDDLTEAESRSDISRRWSAFLTEGFQEGTLRLKDRDGRSRDIQYSARGSVLPVRHIVVFRNKSNPVTGTHAFPVASANETTPCWIQDYALFLLDADGRIAAWYGGAERIYGHESDNCLGQHISLCYPQDTDVSDRLENELKRAAAEGHCCDETWQERKDGSRFWANIVTKALRDGSGDLRGFAAVVRDFSDRQGRDETLRRNRKSLRPLTTNSVIAGVVSGTSDGDPEANDAFLELVGYDREDLRTGRLNWPDLTPPQFAPLDELAHEESLRFGASTPYEKDLIRKDGTRIAVRVATAILSLTPFRWITFVQSVCEPKSAPEDSSGLLPRNHTFDEIVGISSTMAGLMGQVEIVAPTDATVLVLGETGTGKELIARAIHRISGRRNAPWISINCAAIPSGLLESELFGYERGAFTGALSRKIGRFEMANHGTLFLDEVGEIPLDLQPKLLRALQEKTFERLGGTTTIPIDVRLIAATNRNLIQMVNQNLFRMDLYYRLKVFPITTPPLRERPEDIPLLARHFVRKHAANMERPIDRIPSATIAALVNWPWPGNVRELENFIERSVILSEGSSLYSPLGELAGVRIEPVGESTLEGITREHILRTLREMGGVVSKSALRLGLRRTTLAARMKRMGISRTNLG